eukprot:15480512-Alexandrium_andersonii.AAC.1
MRRWRPSCTPSSGRRRHAFARAGHGVAESRGSTICDVAILQSGPHRSRSECCELWAATRIVLLWVVLHCD